MSKKPVKKVAAPVKKPVAKKSAPVVKKPAPKTKKVTAPAKKAVPAKKAAPKKVARPAVKAPVKKALPKKSTPKKVLAKPVKKVVKPVKKVAVKKAVPTKKVAAKKPVIKSIAKPEVREAVIMDLTKSQPTSITIDTPALKAKPVQPIVSKYRIPTSPFGEEPPKREPIVQQGMLSGFRMPTLKSTPAKTGGWHVVTPVR